MIIKTELQTKLKDLRLFLGYKNQTSFAEKLGVSQAAIANIEGGKREVSKSILLKIKEIFDIDLISWRNSPQAENTIQSGNIVPIPFYSAKAAAGLGETLPDYPEKDVIYFDIRWLKNILGVNPDNISIIQAKGDSMQSTPTKENDINDGDLLMVDESYKEPINNQIFVINLGNNDIVVKRINRHWDGQIKLESNNPKYPDIIPAKDATIIGKVVWNGSKENI